jgi:hypothetical protein
MEMGLVLIGVIVTAVIASCAVALLFSPTLLGTARWGMPGRSIPWRLDSRRVTEIISNKRLGAIQAHKADGGVLGHGDIIIVWAREFLDDDILYEVVRRNVSMGIAYLYILDVAHYKRFQTLYESLKRDISEPRHVKDAIKAIFVQQELTLNNFVLIVRNKELHAAFSALIYDFRPFGWLRQHTIRAEIMHARVKELVASVALAQARDTQPSSLEYVAASDQLMNFSQLGKNFLDLGIHSPGDAKFSLEDEVAKVEIPPDIEEWVTRLKTKAQAKLRVPAAAVIDDNASSDAEDKVIQLQERVREVRSDGQ